MQLSGPDGVITSGEHSRLAALRPHAVADGRQHVVRVVYYKYINYDYVNYFTASTYLATFLKDNGEVRRVLLVVMTTCSTFVTEHLWLFILVFRHRVVESARS